MLLFLINYVSNGTNEAIHTGSREPTVRFSGILWASWSHIGNLNPTMVGVLVAQTPQVLSPQDGPHFRCLSSALGHPYLWLTGCKPPSQVWSFAIEAHGISRKHLTYYSRFIIKDILKDTNERPDEEVHGTRSKRVPSTELLFLWSWVSRAPSMWIRSPTSLEAWSIKSLAMGGGTQNSNSLATWLFPLEWGVGGGGPGPTQQLSRDPPRLSSLA